MPVCLLSRVSLFRGERVRSLTPGNPARMHTAKPVVNLNPDGIGPKFTKVVSMDKKAMKPLQPQSRP